MKNPAALLAPIVLSLAGCGWWNDHMITPRELREYVTILASDEMGGRDPGTPGIAEAEDYIASQFSQFGLDPAPGDTDQFLQFEVYRHGYDPETTQFTFSQEPERAVIKGDLGVDFRPFWFSDRGRVAAAVVFAGYGITAPEHDWDDYADLDVRGKLVLILRHEPDNANPDSPFDGTKYTHHAYFITKARNAQKHGAAGMLLFTDPHFGAAGADDLRVSRSLSLDANPPSQSGETVPLLAIHITQDLASQILAPTGYDLASLQAAIDEGLSPAAVDLTGLSSTLEIGGIGPGQPVAVRNVAGFLRGRDPALAKEIIVIGGHHDHLGAIPGQSGDTIFNGADDNASGTAGVLELAELFAKRVIRPRRSLLFITFSAEEAGLLGSEALFTETLLPTEDVVFMINLDMIGRNPADPVSIFGAGYGIDIRTMVKDLARESGLPFKYEGIGSLPANSDYGSFLDREVPFLSLFTGTHDDYHELSDHADKLAYPRMAELLRFTALFIDKLDGRDNLTDG